MDDVAKKIWDGILKILKLKINESDYKSWLLNVTPIKLTEDSFIVEVDNSFIKEKIEKRFKKLIIEILNDLLVLEGYKDLVINVKKINIDYNSEAEQKVQDAESKQSSVLESNKRDYSYSSDNYNDMNLKNNNINQKYMFDNFVVGKSNELVYAAANAIANGAKKGYNPFFIHGGVGLGKTHLMQAIGNEVLKKDLNKKVYYCSSEQFTNDLINSIKNDRMIDFRKKYRELDLLLIDDIQFIAGKDSTQEEYFHTFNELHQDGKQIVMSSDRPPKELNEIEKRLLSRFEWGLIADIQQPDFETRVAILKKKSELENILVGEEILEKIADTVNSNIRELEGALNRIVARASLLKKDITPALVDEVFYDVKKSQSKLISKDKIISIVSEFYDVRIEDMKSNKRKKDIAKARQIAMYLLRDMLSLPFASIGQMFGGKDHTTVMHSVTKIENEINSNKYFEKDLEGIIEKIKN